MWGSGTRILRFNQKDYQETNQQLRGVVASTVPPNTRARSPPVTNWQNRCTWIIPQVICQPPRELPMGSGHCTAWRPACGTVSMLYPQSPKRQAGGVPAFQKVSTQKRSTRASPPTRPQKLMTQSKKINFFV